MQVGQVEEGKGRVVAELTDRVGWVERVTKVKSVQFRQGSQVHQVLQEGGCQCKKRKEEDVEENDM